MASATLDTSDARGAHAEQRLRDELIVWLTTVRPSGQPDTVPVWFLWDGATLLFYSRPNQAKLRNIARNPRVSVVVDNTHGGGDVVRVEGTAEQLPDHPRATAVPAYVTKYAAAIERIGHDPDSFAAAYSEAIRVTPTKFH
jgi:PPOX class probable F420-dependent enzyme